MSGLPDRPLVKICGVKQIDHAQAASDAGADFIGFNFSALSPRRVSAERAREIIDALQGDTVPVGLFVEQSVEQIEGIATATNIRMLQVFWRDDTQFLLDLNLPYMLVRRTEPDATYDSVAPGLERVMNSANPPRLFLIDSYHPGAMGGTGVLANWGLAAQLAKTFPVMLAGGLKPSNVAEAIESVRPLGVDVASGVESNGEKSPELIRAFVESARAAFARYSSSSEMTVQS